MVWTLKTFKPSLTPVKPIHEGADVPCSQQYIENKVYFDWPLTYMAPYKRSLLLCDTIKGRGTFPSWVYLYPLMYPSTRLLYSNPAAPHMHLSFLKQEYKKVFTPPSSRPLLWIQLELNGNMTCKMLKKYTESNGLKIPQVSFACKSPGINIGRPRASTLKTDKRMNWCRTSRVLLCCNSHGINIGRRRPLLPHSVTSPSSWSFLYNATGNDDECKI